MLTFKKSFYKRLLFLTFSPCKLRQTLKTHVFLLLILMVFSAPAAFADSEETQKYSAALSIGTYNLRNPLHVAWEKKPYRFDVSSFVEHRTLETFDSTTDSQLMWGFNFAAGMAAYPDWLMQFEIMGYQKFHNENQIEVKNNVNYMNFLLAKSFYQNRRRSGAQADYEFGINTQYSTVETKLYNTAFEAKSRTEPSLVLGVRHRRPLFDYLSFTAGLRAYISEKLHDNYDLAAYIGFGLRI